MKQLIIKSCNPFEMRWTVRDIVTSRRVPLSALFLSRIWPTVKGQEEEISDVNCDNREEIIVQVAPLTLSHCTGA